MTRTTDKLCISHQSSRTDLEAILGADRVELARTTAATGSGEAMPQATGFYEKRSGSIQYVVADPATRQCAIIDPVLDFDEKSGCTATRSADAILDYVKANGLTIQWVLDTHPHADHFSAARYLKDKTSAPTGIGEKVIEVQKLWKDIYNWPDFPPTARNGTGCLRRATSLRWDLFRQGSCSLPAIRSPRSLI